MIHKMSAPLPSCKTGGRGACYSGRAAHGAPSGEARPHTRRYAATGYGVLATGKHLFRFASLLPEGEGFGGAAASRLLPGEKLARRKP